MEKIFKQKNFNNFVWTPLVVELTYIQIFAFKFNLRWLQPDIFPIIGKFSAGVADTGGNFPLVSLTPVANLPPASLIPVVNLPPVSLTPVKCKYVCKCKYCKIINPTQVWILQITNSIQARILQIIYKITNMFSKAWLWKYVQTRNQHNKYISLTCTGFEMVL
jgi:hypothetical protein